MNIKCKNINWNAVTAIATILALISTVLISSMQMKRSRVLFETQFRFDTTYSKNQFSFDTAYLREQIKIMKSDHELTIRQIERNDLINDLNMKLTKQAITYDDKNKAKIIPQILYIDLIDKHWNLKRIMKLLNEEENDARIDFLFKTKLNVLTYSSISNYDLFIAFDKNSELAYGILNIYNNISKLYEEHLKEGFNKKVDTIIPSMNSGISADSMFPINGKSFNDISILKNTLIEIENKLNMINGIYKYQSKNDLINRLERKISFDDIVF